MERLSHPDPSILANQPTIAVGIYIPAIDHGGNEANVSDILRDHHPHDASDRSHLHPLQQDDHGEHLRRRIKRIIQVLGNLNYKNCFQN
jgi:hypothetical protein